MHKKFDHTNIEKKWQESWEMQELYKTSARDVTKEKKYILVEFPYPSGNLHIGHWFAFSVVDIYARFERMQGKQVFFPIGFDSFGLPAENAAIKRDLDPKKWTYDNIAFMQGQLRSMGNSFAWDATLRTSDPDYYRFTQWMFTEFVKNDIAYRGEAEVNWCPSCNTVLANEQVVASECERCGAEVIKKRMQQWMMRITKCADALIDDLDALPWPNHIKESQKNWIGRSEGSELSFTLSTGDSLKVFTTRADTLFGATYLVMAPEHSLLSTLQPHITNWDEVAVYQSETSKKKDIERTAEGKEKTGVKLEGIFATNPATKEQIPVYIADYVLAKYGTGAIMAVPAHDERDFAFAKKFNEKITPVINLDPIAGERGTAAHEIHALLDSYYPSEKGELINSAEFDGLEVAEAKKKITETFGGKLTKTYKLRDWSVGRQRYWGVPIPIVYDPEGNPHSVPKEHLPWLLPEDVDFKPTGEAPLAKSQELKDRTEKIFGKGWRPEVETMDTFVDSSWYFLRYTDVKNDTEFSSKIAQEAWMPIDIYFGGAEHTTMHLLYSRFWQKALYDLGHVTEREPYRMRINRGLVLGPDGNKMSKSKGNVIDPDEQVRLLGADTVRMYLAFMGPYGESSNYPWDMGGIVGIRRFLERVNGLKDHVRETEDELITQKLHETIEKVTADCALYKFNTAISALMVYLNAVEKSSFTRESYQTFLCLLAPFAPHITEELWEEDGQAESIHLASWPKADRSVLARRAVTVAVQFNGKTRGTVQVPFNSEEEVVWEVLVQDPKFATYTAQFSTTKIHKIYVPNRVINIISEKT